jgi:predicted Zn-dependent peptidase
MDYTLFTFPNGIRLVHREVNTTKLVHCGYMLDIGSRDEAQQQQGIAHFWEHMAFKGTHKRKSFHILNSLDSIGGELNAYTTKEKICFHASVLSEYFTRAADLLTDITFHSVFPEKQIEKERNVILEEMAMYYDSPEDAIQDDFDQLVFTNHSLGNNILGTQDTVSGFRRDDFLRFIADNLDTSKLIFSVVGNISFAKTKRVMERLLADIPTKTNARKRTIFQAYQPMHQEKFRNVTQTQSAIGRPAYSISDPKRIPFVLLTNLLGGPAMNTRLNMELREKYGYVYGIDAHYTSYIDTSLFAIYFGTDSKHLKRCKQLVYKELKRLREQPLGKVQLQRAKDQLIGQMAMGEENNPGLMIMMARGLLDLGRVDSLEDVYAKIRAITEQQLMDIANEVFVEDQLSSLSFLPEPL